MGRDGDAPGEGTRPKGSQGVESEHQPVRSPMHLRTLALWGLGGILIALRLYPAALGTGVTVATVLFVAALAGTTGALLCRQPTERALTIATAAPDIHSRLQSSDRRAQSSGRARVGTLSAPRASVAQDTTDEALERCPAVQAGLLPVLRDDRGIFAASARESEPAPSGFALGLRYSSDDRYQLISLVFTIESNACASEGAPQGEQYDLSLPPRPSFSLAPGWRGRVWSSLLPTTCQVLAARQCWLPAPNSASSPGSWHGPQDSHPDSLLCTALDVADAPDASAMKHAHSLHQPSRLSADGPASSPTAPAATTDSAHTAVSAITAGEPLPPRHPETGSAPAERHGTADTAASSSSRGVCVLVDVMCTLDIDSACEGEPTATAARQALLQRLDGGSTALPERVLEVLLGRHPEDDMDGVIVTVQAEDLLLLRYIYFAGAGVWLPLGSPTLPWSDPAALPPASGCVSGSSSSSSSSSPDGPHITVAVEPCVLAVGCANNTCSCCRTAALEPQSGWSGAGFPSSGGVGYPASSVRAGLPGSGGTGVGVEGGPSCPDSGCYCVRELQVTVQYTVPQCEVAWDRGFVMAVQGEGREEGKDEEQQEQAEAKEELILQAHVYCSACAFGFPHRGGAAEGELGAGADAALGCAEAQEDDPQDLCGCKHWEVRGGPWVSVSAQPADAVPHPWATGPGGAVAPGAAASAPLAWGQPVVRQAVGMVQVGMAPLAAPQPPPWRSQTLTASAGPGASMPPRGAEPRGFAALLVVEAWRHGRLCGVGHALLLPSNGLLPPPPAHQTTGFATPIAMGVDQAPGPQTPQQPQQALQQARPSAPGPAWLQEAVAIAHTLTLSPATQQCIESSTAAAPAVAAAAQAAAGPRVSVVSGKQGYISARVAVRRPSYRRTALTRLRSWGSGGSGSSSFADQSPRECSPGLLQLRAQQAAAQRGEDPRDLFLQDLGLFLVYALAQATDALSPAFSSLALRSRLAVHKALVRAGCRTLDAAVEAGAVGLARELAGRLRGLGCADREMLVGGLGRPAGLPLLHLALLSGSVEMALMVVGWCQSSSCLSEDWCRTVHVVTAVGPPSPQVASPGEAPAASPGSPVRSASGAEDPHHHQQQQQQQQQAERSQGRESGEAQYRSVSVAPMALAERLGIKPQLELLAALSAASGSSRGSPVTPTLSLEAAAWHDAAFAQHGR